MQDDPADLGTSPTIARASWGPDQVALVARGLLSTAARAALNPRRAQVVLRATRRSCLPIYRLSGLADMATAAPPGALVECGSYRGGSASVLAFARPDQHLWLFDSWDGFPDPDPIDVSRHGRKAERGDFMASYQDTQQFLVATCGLSSHTLHMHAGWFEHTIPAKVDEIGPIALLHIDCDLYESTTTCLELLYEQVLPAGVVVVDDYGDWEGCRRACDVFVAKQAALGKTVSVRFTDRSQVVLTRS